MPPLSANKNDMNDSFLYTVPQWIIFAGIASVIYGWAESKRPFRIIGTSILIILGFYSLYVLLNGFLAAHKFLTPYEIANEELELDTTFEEVPFQVQIFPAYISFLVTAGLAIPALIFELLHKKLFRLFIVLAILAALFGFFIIVGTLKMI